MCERFYQQHFIFQKGRCVSTYTRSHFSKPTYNELCVTNVLFGNKQHIDITLSWCKVLSTDNVVFQSHFHCSVVRVMYKCAQKVYEFGQRHSEVSSLSYIAFTFRCRDSQASMLPRLEAPPYLFLRNISLVFLPRCYYALLPQKEVVTYSSTEKDSHFLFIQHLYVLNVSKLLT